jgi:hypothetical protein
MTYTSSASTALVGLDLTPEREREPERSLLLDIG